MLLKFIIFVIPKHDEFHNIYSYYANNIVKPHVYLSQNLDIYDVPTDPINHQNINNQMKEERIIVSNMIQMSSCLERQVRKILTSNFEQNLNFLELF